MDHPQKLKLYIQQNSIKQVRGALDLGSANYPGCYEPWNYSGPPWLFKVPPGTYRHLVFASLNLLTLKANYCRTPSARGLLELPAPLRWNARTAGSLLRRTNFHIETLYQRTPSHVFCHFRFISSCSIFVSQEPENKSHCPQSPLQVDGIVTMGCFPVPQRDH